MCELKTTNLDFVNDEASLDNLKLSFIAYPTFPSSNSEDQVSDNSSLSEELEKTNDQVNTESNEA